MRNPLNVTIVGIFSQDVFPLSKCCCEYCNRGCKVKKIDRNCSACAFQWERFLFPSLLSRCSEIHLCPSCRDNSKSLFPSCSERVSVCWKEGFLFFFLLQLPKSCSKPFWHLSLMELLSFPRIRMVLFFSHNEQIWQSKLATSCFPQSPTTVAKVSSFRRVDRSLLSNRVASAWRLLFTSVTEDVWAPITLLALCPVCKRLRYLTTEERECKKKKKGRLTSRIRSDFRISNVSSTRCIVGEGEWRQTVVKATQECRVFIGRSLLSCTEIFKRERLIPAM